MSKPTPAPWRIRNPEEAGKAMLGILSEPTNQGLAYTVGLGIEADLANAHLIAAAPELLEALKGLLENYQVFTRGNKVYAPCEVKAAQAISKAETK